jgi:protein ImuB
MAGPERIESGWWDDGDARPDYFVAVDHQGRWPWIFRDLRPPGGG